MIHYTDTTSPVMRLDHYGDETRSPGEHYWVCNTWKRNADAGVLQYVHTGVLQVEREGIRYTASAGSALLLRNGEMSWYGLPEAATQRSRFRWVELRGPGVQEHWRLLLERFGPVIADSPHGDLHNRMAALIEKVIPLQEKNPLDAALLIYRFVLFLHRHAAQQAEHTPSPVECAIAQMTDNPMWAGSLKQLAFEAGCTRDHLTRVFRARMGVTPKEWLIAQRVRAAIWLLRETTLPLDDIVHQAGLGTAHTLRRLVKEETGHSPRALRPASLHKRPMQDGSVRAD